MASCFIYNGTLQTQHPREFYSFNSSAIKYGDGFFETIKVLNGHICLQPFHVDRLYKTLAFFNYKIINNQTPEMLMQQALQLCVNNQVQPAARIRVTIANPNHLLVNTSTTYCHYSIEALPLNPQEAINDISLGVCPIIAKSTQALSNYKNNNFLEYKLAAQWAFDNNFNDALVVNTNGCIADSSIANVFIVKDDTLLTPSLQQGCIAGVTRAWVIQAAKDLGIEVQETSLTVEQIINADAVFLTNAIKGLYQVKKFTPNSTSFAKNYTEHSLFITLNQSYLHQLKK